MRRPTAVHLRLGNLGTSMASPHVANPGEFAAGLAALLVEHNDYDGHGRINVARALGV